jgi:hypothetical protein
MAARGAPAVARLVLSPDGSATPLKFMAFVMDCALSFAVSGFLCFHLKLVYYNQVPRPRRPCRLKARSNQYANDFATSSLDPFLYLRVSIHERGLYLKQHRARLTRAPLTQTTIESDADDFDVGWRRNVTSVFGDDPRLWLLPVYGGGPRDVHSVHDGVHWPRRRRDAPRPRAVALSPASPSATAFVFPSEGRVS